MRSPWRGCSPRCFRWTDPWVTSCLTCVPGKCFFGYSTFEALLQSSFSTQISSKTSSGKSVWMWANPRAPVYFICEMITLQESHGSSNYVLCEWLIPCPAITLDSNTSSCMTVCVSASASGHVEGGGARGCPSPWETHGAPRSSDQVRLQLHIYPFCDLGKFYAPFKSH